MLRLCASGAVAPTDSCANACGFFISRDAPATPGTIKRGAQSGKQLAQMSRSATHGANTRGPDDNAVCPQGDGQLGLQRRANAKPEKDWNLNAAAPDCRDLFAIRRIEIIAHAGQARTCLQEDIA
jgi:hypothetical protein